MNACCNTGDTAVIVYGYFIINGCSITKQGDSCAFAVSQLGCCAVQSQFCTVIANAFDANQILVQLNLNSVNTIFCILAYADILVTIEVNIIAGFYIFCFGQNTISSKLPSAVLQLAYIYSIIVVNACSYACNTTIIVYAYFTIDNGCITKQFYGCALTISQFGCKTAQCQFSIPVADGFDINQILVQLNLNLSAVIAYADILIAAEINIFTRCYINSGSSSTVSGKIPAFICICSYLFDFFQLAYIIYNQFAAGCIECTVAVYKERHNSVFCHSTYGQIVFGIQYIGLNGVCIYIRCRSSHRRSHACTGHNTCCNQHCQQLFGRAAFTAMIFCDFGNNNISVACFAPNYFKNFVHQKFLPYKYILYNVRSTRCVWEQVKQLLY